MQQSGRYPEKQVLKDVVSAFQGVRSEISGVNGFVLKRRQGLDLLAGFLLGKAQFAELFQVEPKLRTGAEKVGQAQGA